MYLNRIYGSTACVLENSLPVLNEGATVFLHSSTQAAFILQADTRRIIGFASVYKSMLVHTLNVDNIKAM